MRKLKIVIIVFSVLLFIAMVGKNVSLHIDTSMPKATIEALTNQDKRIWFTASDAHNAYYVDYNGTPQEIAIANHIAIKSYNHRSQAGSFGINYAAGYYSAASADANLTQASATVNYGSAGTAYCAHAFLVAGGAGSTDGSDLVVTVSGTSFDLDGTLTTSDTEVIVIDATAASLNEYFETVKRWVGQITYTLSSTGGATFSFDFNYGLAKYDDITQENFNIIGASFIGLAGANDSGFDIDILKHSPAGWSYAATGFIPGGTVIISLLDDLTATYNDLSNGEYFTYRRFGFSELIDVENGEGFIIRITTTTNAAVEYMNCHITTSLVN